MLHLDGNGVKLIEGISHMHNMRSLFLHDNLIAKMQGLDKFTQLDTLNLANNLIEKIEGIENCQKLTKLDMSGNRLTNFESIRNIEKNPTLTMFMLKGNERFAYEEKTEQMFSRMSIRLLDFRQTDYVRQKPNYRKSTIAAIKSVCFLDEKPV